MLGVSTIDLHMPGPGSSVAVPGDWIIIDGPACPRSFVNINKLIVALI